jgi:hypothetical protein
MGQYQRKLALQVATLTDIILSRIPQLNLQRRAGRNPSTAKTMGYYL